MPATRLAAETPLGPKATEAAITFGGGSRPLRGNLIRAPGASVGVLFLHGWAGNRSGPHGLLTAAARHLAGLGIPSLRFDFSGRGESGGQAASVSLDDMAEDALAAADCLCREAGVRQLLLAGICSGGNVGIGILDRLPQANGLFLLSVYPFSDGDSFGRGAHRTWHYLRAYWRKAWLPETWAKLRDGAIDVRQVWRVLFGHFSRRRQPAASSGATEPGAAGRAQASPLRNLLLQPRRIRMVYGDADPDFDASHAYYREFAAEHGLPMEFHIYAGADHNFYSAVWTEELAAELGAFAEESI